jgi:hypothetical protein
MNTDTFSEAETLDDRLDRIDHDSRVRRTVVGVVAIAAAAVLAIAAVALWPNLNRNAQPATPAPAPSASYTSAFFVDPFTATLPAWLDDGRTRPVYRSSSYQYWSHCATDADCGDLSVSWVSGVATASSIVSIDARGLVDHLTALGTAGRIRITSTSSTTVGGRPATDLRVQTIGDIPGALGCGSVACQDITGASLARYVVVDMGAGAAPVLVWADAPQTNVRASTWMSQLDTFLHTLRFTGIGAIEGRWAATLTAEQARAAVSAAGLSQDQVAGLGDPVRLSAVFSSGFALVSVVRADGSVVTPIANLSYRTTQGQVTLADGEQLAVTGGPSTARFTPTRQATTAPSTREQLAKALLVAATWAR